MLLERFTYLDEAAKPEAWQRSVLESDVKNALTLNFLEVNPLPYHEMRRGMIIGLGEIQWKATIGHIFPEILNNNNKLHMVASQNIDGLDHKVLTDKSKLYNPHGLMSTLVSEPLDDFICTDPCDPIYRKYVELVKTNIKDIYADRPARKGKSSHLWPGPVTSTPITLDMFGDLLPSKFEKARARETKQKLYSVKPGSVLFDRTLWRSNAAREPYDAFSDVRSCDMLLVMGTSLSGLTIDEIAHSAGRLGTPRVVFDMTTAPVDSIRARGPWAPDRDCFMQGSIDESILDILSAMEWIDQLLEYLPLLCLGSLRKLKQHVADHISTGNGAIQDMERIDCAIQNEMKRESNFYGDE